MFEVKNIKAYLANENITIRDFSKIVDISPDYCGRIFRGEILPSRQLAKRIYCETNGFLKLPYKLKKRHTAKSEEAFWSV